MRIVMLAQGDPLVVERLAEPLRAAGYHVTVCPAPQPPAYCPRQYGDSCTLADGADLLIYDPSLHWKGPLGQEVCLAAATAQANPDIPMLLSPMRRDQCHLLDRFPQIQPAPSDPGELVQKVFELIGWPIGPT